VAESTLTYSFSDLWADCAEFAGLGRSPTGDDLTMVKRRVNDAYRQFLGVHDWKFLKRTAVLTTESGRWFYDLPDDFTDLAMPFKFPTDNSWLNPNEIDEATIIELRTGSGSTSGRPYVFALRTKEYSEEEGTRWEVVFHYTPNGIYEFIYSYRIITNELVNDEDLPIGGPEHAVLLRAFCLAEVEAFDEESLGTWSGRLPALIAAAIRKDNKKSAASVGIMGGGALRGYERREQTITYNDVSVDL